MPRELLSTNAPLSAAGSAARRAIANEDHAFILAEETAPLRPEFRMVAGGAPVINPVVEGAGYPAAARASVPGGEILAKDWAEDWPEDPLDSIETRTEARVDDGGSRAPFLAVGEKSGGESKAPSGSPQSGRNRSHGNLAANGGAPRRPGLKKLNRKQIALDLPPTPLGCEWRRSEEGLNLWHCWTDWNDDKTQRIKKSRYAGHLSDDAWRIMKEYDHEAFISIVGERLRRHSGR
ncbi:MAG: hypothetical protein J2P52_07070 [Blastocatellia bacterium]|nr:hypothetical protein [Blastocatellia bacterium]